MHILCAYTKFYYILHVSFLQKILAFRCSIPFNIWSMPYSICIISGQGPTVSTVRRPMIGHSWPLSALAILNVGPCSRTPWRNISPPSREVPVIAALPRGVQRHVHLLEVVLGGLRKFVEALQHSYGVRLSPELLWNPFRSNLEVLFASPPLRFKRGEGREGILQCGAAEIAYLLKLYLLTPPRVN